MLYGAGACAQPDSSGFYGHNYCGTFFINVTRDNSFTDED